MNQPFTPSLPQVPAFLKFPGRRLVLAGGVALAPLLLTSGVARAQTPGPAEVPAATVVTLTGTLRDASGQPLELAAVGIEGQPGGANTTAEGAFSLQVRVPAPGQPVVLVVRRLGYLPLRLLLKLPADASRPLRLAMRLDTKALGGVRVTGRASQADTREQVSITHIDPRSAKEIPSPFGDFSGILKTVPGVG